MRLWRGREGVADARRGIAGKGGVGGRHAYSKASSMLQVGHSSAVPSLLRKDTLPDQPNTGCSKHASKDLLQQPVTRLAWVLVCKVH
jgi:hypothetical protein